MRGCHSDQARSEMEDALYHFKGDLVIGSRLANAGRKNETQHPASGLLVGTHCFHQFRRGNAWPRRQGSEPTNERHDAGNVLGGSEADFVPKKSSGHHAPSDGFAMLIAAIVGNTFQNMRKSMSKIEDFAQPGFALIAADHARFD